MKFRTAFLLPGGADDCGGVEPKRSAPALSISELRNTAQTAPPGGPSHVEKPQEARRRKPINNVSVFDDSAL